MGVVEANLYRITVCLCKLSIQKALCHQVLLH
nr:MAG TPA: hypothetical protein [Caudoviricetes sp.]